jgi:hypothetical protein
MSFLLLPLSLLQTERLLLLPVTLCWSPLLLLALLQLLLLRLLATLRRLLLPLLLVLLLLLLLMLLLVPLQALTLRLLPPQLLFLCHSAAHAALARQGFCFEAAEGDGKLHL